VAEGKKHIAEKAMIIEDEKDLCYLLSLVLKQINMQSHCVYSISEAKQSIKKLMPSIVFLDNHLPDGYGSDFIATVKDINPAAKIIMITAFDGQEDMDIALRRGADYFICKPFDTEKIEATISLIKARA
jgi:two-component system OmpR family response regulator